MPLPKRQADKPVFKNMTAAIVRRRQETGSVTELDLLAEGFTQAQINVYGEAAREAAATQLQRAGR